MSEILAETMTIVDELATDAVKDIVAEGLIKAQAAIITDFAFYAFMFGAIAITFGSTKSWLIHDFFNRFGHGVPIASWGIEIGADLADVFLSTSIVAFMWQSRDPLDNEEAGWYVAQFSLYVAIIFLKSTWSTLLWRYHHYKPALWVGAAFGLGTVIAVFVEMIFFFVKNGERARNADLVIIIPLLIYACGFAFNCWLIWRQFISEAPIIEARLNREDERMLRDAQTLPPPNAYESRSYGMPYRR